MGTKYVTEAISGYNASPPDDDGTQSEANKVKWATTKGKLADPLKDQVANIDTKLVAMADIGPDAKIVNYTTVAGDHEKTIEVTAAGVTLTLLAVASAPAGYKVTVKNSSGSTATLATTGAEEIDGSATSITLADNETIAVQLNQAGSAYISLQQVASTGAAGLTSVNTFTKTQTWSKGADLTTSDVTAGILAIGTDGNYFDFTGTDTLLGFSNAPIGTVFKIHFDAAALLTHSATDLFLPGEANYTTAAGDEFEFTVYATDDVRCTGYVLASGLPILPPTALQGSSMVLLSSATASSSASVDFTGLDDTYDEYLITITELAAATDVQALAMRIGDSGSYRSDALYTYHTTNVTASAATYAGFNSTSDTTIILASSIGNATEEGYSGWVRISNPESTKKVKITYDGVSFDGAGAIRYNAGAGSYFGTLFAVDRVRFIMGTGNIASGEFRMYGIKKV